MLYHSINGQFGGIQAPDEGLLDRGLAYGHGLFESMLLCSGTTALQNQHVERICRDAKKLGINLQPSILHDYLNDFQSSLNSHKVEAGVIKLMVTAGIGGRGYQSPDSISPKVICAYTVLPDSLSEQRAKGIKLWRCDYRLPQNPRLAGIKHLNRLDQVMARREWGSSDYAEGLMLDQAGGVIEATAANIFIRTKQGWETPLLSEAGVAGVMRSVLIREIFAAENIAPSIAAIPLQRLEDCSEIFACNAIRGIVPVVGIAQSSDLRSAAISFEIGEQTRSLQNALTQRYPCFQ